MVYLYRRVLISGTEEGVEGVSAGLAAISTFMQDCGWNLYDDRSAQPGSSLDTTHMKYVFSSNGEEGNYPTYFMTLTSGSTASPNSNLMYMSISTAYDLGTHTTATSGVDTRSLLTNADTNGDGRFQIMSQSDNTEIYMAGDSEMVHLISRKETDNNSTNTMDNVYFGRFNSFFTVDENPYPLIVFGVPGNTISAVTTTFPRGVWGNPPESSSIRGHVSTVAPTQITTSDPSQPYDMGVDSIFIAVPIAVYYIGSASSPPQAVAGTVRNGWVGADRTRLLNLSILTASGSGGAQEYITFTNQTSLSIPSIIVRKT